eukprot:CAMPEP_0113852272 /NCGR_PEP_ID=MMETSP0372-20130328/5355_1 /TAXON_ID=340204 /ORGANISM="Lankesteria abbotti" /LENGTH=88 /DNA_ID=CAMNT_0000823677 /DNA_START=75 /DNA_END=341 /DNA_ORIENTATION=- /assembly_acc=CAM_ASM_000359
MRKAPESTYGNVVFPTVFYGNPIGVSEAHKEKVDLAVEALLDRAYERARRILTAIRYQLDKLAKALLQFETLNQEEIKRIAYDSVTRS